MKESETPLFPLLGVLEEHQANGCNINAEDQVQTHAGPLLVLSVSAHLSLA